MEGSKINIPSYIKENNYRYQMPVMKLKVEGRGKNIRTNIENMVDVSKALNVNTEYPLKFIGLELGSRIIYERNGNDITTSLKGVFQYDDLIKQLDKFIEKYVLCPNCHLPEVHLRIRGKGKDAQVHGKCESCGFRGKLDNEHKMANYMVDPKSQPIKWGIEEKQKKQAEKEGAEEQATAESSKAARKAAAESQQFSKADLALDGQLIKSQIEIFKELVKENLAEGTYKQFKNPENAKKELVQQLYTISVDKGLDDRLFYVLFQGLFTINVAHEIERSATVLIETAQRLKLDVSRESILNLEYLTFVVYQKEKFLNAVPTLLKFFYDADLLEEAFLVRWSDSSEALREHFLYNEQRDAEFKAAAKPFLDWIKQPAEDDEEEEEGQQAPAQGTEAQKPQETLNIDDI